MDGLSGYNGPVRRRLFMIASVVSLLMCVTTVVLWVRSVEWYACILQGDGDVGGPGQHPTVEVATVNGDIEIGWTYSDYLSDRAFWKMPFPGTFAIAAILPSVWLLRRRRQERSTERCRACGYNLTGNTSGICPECGTAILRGSGAAA